MKEKIRAVPYYCIMAKLLNDPNTCWEYLLGEELYYGMKPEYIAPKGKKRNGWKFDTTYATAFQVMTALYFTPEMMGNMNMAIERIIKEGEEE